MGGLCELCYLYNLNLHCGLPQESLFHAQCQATFVPESFSRLWIMLWISMFWRSELSIADLYFLEIGLSFVDLYFLEIGMSVDFLEIGLSIGDLYFWEIGFVHWRTLRCWHYF